MTTAASLPPVQKHVQIVNVKGIHARSAAKIVKLCDQFSAQIFLQYKEIEVPADSIMGLMLLSVRQGAYVGLRAVGPDSEQAICALSDLIKRKFDEE